MRTLVNQVYNKYVVLLFLTKFLRTRASPWKWKVRYKAK